ncbi:hypothetical protein AVEN_141764-1 [Araneus ventricosus]|uniref:Uncharacterized protein n=1 Tax=Araneus ventricosus TaxID=182803 RepID=A0A4Y2NKA1_ARAVE|nr:hypothetical protein AVEN_141764-1 [Araneus ventricosus]
MQPDTGSCRRRIRLPFPVPTNQLVRLPSRMVRNGGERLACNKGTSGSNRSPLVASRLSQKQYQKGAEGESSGEMAVTVGQWHLWSFHQGCAAEGCQ